jgi:hypothetical protein
MLDKIKELITQVSHGMDCYNGKMSKENVVRLLKSLAYDAQQDEAELNRLRAEVDKYKSKEDDFNCLLKSEGEQLIFKISANVDEITNMVSIEGGGEYTIFVSDAFKTSEADQESLSNLSHEILNVLMGALIDRYVREQKDGGQ